MDVSQYLEIFLDETREHLENLNTRILQLEQQPEDEETINEIFRAAHSLKGMSGTMGYKRMQTLTHRMEDVFSQIRGGSLKVSPELIDILFRCLDALEEYTNCIQETADEGTNENRELLDRLNAFFNEEAKAGPSKAEQAKAEPAKAEQDEAGEGSWKQIPLDEGLQQRIRAAEEQGQKAYGLEIRIQEKSILKGARAFLVYKAVEEKAEILVCSPSLEEIEEEKFDRDFCLLLLSELPLEEVIRIAGGVLEVERVTGGVVEVSAPSDDHRLTADAEAASGQTSRKEEDQAEKDKKTGTAGTEKPARSANGLKPAAGRTVRVDIEKLDILMNLVSELIIAKNSLAASCGSEAGRETGSGNYGSRETGSGMGADRDVWVGNRFKEQLEYLESVTTSLHETVMKVRMVPIESVVSKFPRMVRDLSRKLNKKMELHMSGEETELDRTVVDEIGDPLMHLLRNSADHGLESAEVRLSRGKPEVGTIFLKAYQDGNNVVIEVGDDGNGIDWEAVKQTAVSRGIITAAQGSDMSEKDVIGLLFHAGFSTAKQVSEVSGRGVGLDVVKAKIESLSGDIEVKSTLGEGSTWIIRLPLTLAIIQALMIIVGGEKYAIPLGSIQTIEDISPSEIKLVQNSEVIHLRGMVIPLIYLEKELETESRRDPDENLIVVIAKKGERYAGLVVDELMGQQEIVIKPLGKYISRNRTISGATILGDGEVALILDTNALI